MAMRRETGAQGDLVVTWAEMPRSPGHAFYDRLQELLREAGFDAFVEQVCKCKRLTAANGGLDPAFSKGRHSTAFELRPSFAVPENFPAGRQPFHFI